MKKFGKLATVILSVATLVSTAFAFEMGASPWNADIEEGSNSKATELELEVGTAWAGSWVQVSAPNEETINTIDIKLVLPEAVEEGSLLAKFSDTAKEDISIKAVAGQTEYVLSVTPDKWLSVGGEKKAWDDGTGYNIGGNAQVGVEDAVLYITVNNPYPAPAAPAAESSAEAESSAAAESSSAAAESSSAAAPESATQTGDATSVAVLAGIALLALAGVVVTSKKRA